MLLARLAVQDSLEYKAQLANKDSQELVEQPEFQEWLVQRVQLEPLDLLEQLGSQGQPGLLARLALGVLAVRVARRVQLVHRD